MRKTDRSTPGTAATQPDTQALCIFLSRYCAALLGAGATCIRLAKNAERIARAYGRRISITIMPRHVHISMLGDEEREIVTAIESVPAVPISFRINTRLSTLSWQTLDARLPFDELERRFAEITHGDRPDRWSVLVLASLANASFCRLFGGDLAAMLIVFLATAAGFYLKQELLSHRADARITTILCAFLSAVIAASGTIFGFGSTPETALGTSVLYLVPGIPFLNSFSDMLYRHYICAFSRFVDAMITTCCLSIGLCAGMLLMDAGMF